MINNKIKNETQIDDFIKDVNPLDAVLETYDFLQSENRKLSHITQDIYKRGSIPGTAIDGLLPFYLTKNSKYTFTHGEDKKDPDCVCDYPKYHCEVKTSASSKRPVGAKTNAGRVKHGTKYSMDKDNYVYMIFCKHHLSKEANEEFLIYPEEIWIGMVKPSDWKCSASAGSGSAYLPADTFYSQFKKIYDYDESRTFHQIEDLERQLKNNAKNFKEGLIDFDEFNTAQYLIYADLIKLKEA